MVLIEKLWDDVMAGPKPDKGLGKLRKSITLIQNHGKLFIIYDIFFVVTIFIN